MIINQLTSCGLNTVSTAYGNKYRRGTMESFNHGPKP